MTQLFISFFFHIESVYSAYFIHEKDHKKLIEDKWWFRNESLTA